MSLEICGVTKKFLGDDHEVHALSEVNLTVSKGEKLMLVGPSGCGKSTLLNIIAGLTRPDSGQVLLDGQLVTRPGPDRSLVFQDGGLFPWLTVRKNVEFGLKQAGVAPKERQDRAREALDKVGLLRFESRSVHELSGGMRQRVAIARSLVMQPKVLLLDEPFSALDAITREDLYIEIQSLWQENETTAVFVTHNVREAVTLGDRIVLMSPGPGRIQAIYDVPILRPRHIEDIDVAQTASHISGDMKSGRTPDLVLA